MICCDETVLRDGDEESEMNSHLMQATEMEAAVQKAMSPLLKDL